MPFSRNPLNAGAHISGATVIARSGATKQSTAVAGLLRSARNDGLGVGLVPGGEARLAHLALFGGGEFGRILAFDDLDRTARLLDRLARALGHASDLEVELGLELALAEQADAVLAAACKPGGLERRMIQRALDVELAGIDRLLHRADVHFGIIAREDVVEAALRQPHVERHLAAFEAVDRDARARLGALLAAARGLALARANAPADPHAPLAGALVVAEFVEFHVVHSLSLLSRAPREGQDGWVRLPFRRSPDAQLCAPVRALRACPRPRCSCA